MAENKKHVNNDENKYESVNIILSKEKYPIAFEKYVKDIMQGGMTREEAVILYLEAIVKGKIPAGRRNSSRSQGGFPARMG